MLRLPIGYDNFAEIIRHKLDIVDKSLFIRDVIDDTAKVIVITRPRRFGKSLNLSMLHYYFAESAYGESTEGVFKGMKIMEEGEVYLQHYRQYPVIFVSFKDIKAATFEEAYASLCGLMSRLYQEYEFLLDSPELNVHNKKEFESIINKEASKETVMSSLRDLSGYLYKATSVKPWLLIDEYDTPIQSAYLYKYYDDMIGLMKVFFGSALKTNPYLEKSVITGILRISKESLFSDLNNLKVYSVLDDKYSEYFGFTESEANDLIQRSGINEKSALIKEWYNGYQFGNTVVYNPWSIVNCLQDKKIEPYWINTSDNALIKKLLLQSNEEFKADFELLLQDKPIEHFVKKNMVFGDLYKNQTAAWSLLLMSGYLKVIGIRLTDDADMVGTFAIPNREVKSLYNQIIKEWLSGKHEVEWYNNTLLASLLSGKIDQFEDYFREVFEQAVSVHDTAKEPESFYHGLMLGLTTSLHSDPNYEIKSNRESGLGRYDYVIFAKDKVKPSILFEFKRVKDDSKNRNEMLEKTAIDAVHQITKNNYITELKQHGAKEVIKIGLAFCGKHFKMYHEVETLK
jgi:hypothetical protein